MVFNSTCEESSTTIQLVERRLQKLFPECKKLIVWLKEVGTDTYYYIEASQKVYLDQVDLGRRELILKSKKQNSIEIKYHNALNRDEAYQKVSSIVKPILYKFTSIAFIEIN